MIISSKCAFFCIIILFTTLFRVSDLAKIYIRKVIPTTIVQTKKESSTSKDNTPISKLSPTSLSAKTDSSFNFSSITNWADINSHHIKSEIFYALLEGAGYDKRLRPAGLNNGKGPTEVSISLLIRSIDNIDDVKMQYAVQMTFRMEWIDPRLNISKYTELRGKIKYLQLMYNKRIWQPDIYFINEKRGQVHKLVIPDFYMRLFPDGKVLQSYRITLILSCEMDLRAYPLDVQICTIGMESYGWTTEDIIVKWRDKKAVVMETHSLTPNFWKVNHTLTSDTSKMITGNYSCITLNIEFERKFNFYFIQVYIPCSLLCCVSWVSFWLDPCAVEARISLGVTSILATVTQIYGINQSSPPASYLKALDVWTSFCQIMVFSALLECAAITHIMNVRFKTSKRVHCKRASANDEDEIEFNMLIDKSYNKAKTIDTASRLLFPLLFSLFNAVYWGYYLNYYQKSLLIK